MPTMKITRLTTKTLRALRKSNMQKRASRPALYDWRGLKVNQSFFVVDKKYMSMAVLAYNTARRLTLETGKTVKFSVLHDSVKGKEGVRVIRVA